MNFISGAAMPAGNWMLPAEFEHPNWYTLQSASSQQILEERGIESYPQYDGYGEVGAHAWWGGHRNRGGWDQELRGYGRDPHRIGPTRWRGRGGSLPPVPEAVDASAFDGLGRAVSCTQDWGGALVCDVMPRPRHRQRSVTKLLGYGAGAQITERLPWAQFAGEVLQP